MEHKEYIITVVRLGSGTSRAVIRRIDGKSMICDGIEQPTFHTMEAANDEYALQLAIAAIDEGNFQAGS